MSAEGDVYDKGTTVQYIKTFSKNPSRALILPILRHFISESQPQQRLLDLGCGSGEESIIASDSGLDYVGVDLSLEMIKLGRAKGLQATMIGDIGSVPFGDETFDKAISLWALQYKSDIYSTTREWRRVLKTGGELFLVVPHPLYKFVKYSRDYFISGIQWEQGLGIKRFNYYHKLSDYLNSLSQAGFSLREVQETQRIGENKSYGGIPKSNFPHDLVMIGEAV